MILLIQFFNQLKKAMRLFVSGLILCVMVLNPVQALKSGDFKVDDHQQQSMQHDHGMTATHAEQDNSDHDNKCSDHQSCISATNIFSVDVANNFLTLHIAYKRIKFIHENDPFQFHYPELSQKPPKA